MNILDELKAMKNEKDELIAQKRFKERIIDVLKSRKPYEIFDAEEYEESKIAYSRHAKKFLCRLTHEKKELFYNLQKEYLNYRYPDCDHSQVSKEDTSDQVALNIFQQGQADFDLPQRRSAKMDYKS